MKWYLIAFVLALTPPTAAQSYDPFIRERNDLGICILVRQIGDKPADEWIEAIGKECGMQQRKLYRACVDYGLPDKACLNLVAREGLHSLGIGY